MEERKTGGKKRKGTRTGLLDWLGDRKEGLLVLVPVLYGLGYLVWSVNALRNNLGWLPALDLQYFLAGIVPAAVLWATIIFFKHRQQITNFWFKCFNPVHKWRNLGTVIFWVGLGLLFLPGLWGLLSGKEWPSVVEIIRDYFSRRQNPVGHRLLIGYLVYFVYLYFYLIFGSTKLHAYIQKKYRNYSADPEVDLGEYGILTAIGTAVLVLILYIFVIYANLPQELGGLKPRRAYVDMAKDQISQQTLSELCPSTVVSNDAKVVRSKELNIFFAGSSFLLVRPHGVDTSQTHELQRNVVQAITWCPR